MSLNWKEIDLILAELKLEGAFIQQIYQPVHQHIIFDLHKPGNSFSLFCSLAPGVCRFHRLTRKISNSPVPQRFASFLRSRLKGTRITAAYQLAGERIIKITAQKAEIKTILWIRLWSSAANLIVTDEAGNVLDACYRRIKRNEISGGFYNPESDKSFPMQEPSRKEQFTVRELPGTSSFNAGIEAWYFRKEEETTQDDERKKALYYLDSQLKYYEENLQKVTEQLKLTENYLRFKEIGDLIMSSLTEIQKGSQWFITEDFYHDNQRIEIELNPVLTPQANALAYFKKYQQIKEDHWKHTEKKNRIQAGLQELQQKQHQVTVENNLELIKVLAKAREKKQTIAAEKKYPGLCFYSSGYQIMVGRSAAENDELLRKFVRGNDYWFHTRDYAGSYIFVKAIPGKSLPLEVMIDAGSLALFYSKGKNSGKGDVYYTQVKYLRRPKQGKKGLVLPTQEKNLFIVLDETRIEKIKKNQ